MLLKITAGEIPEMQVVQGTASREHTFASPHVVDSSAKTQRAVAEIHRQEQSWMGAEQPAEYRSALRGGYQILVMQAY
jgi:hypothetical protein